MIRKKKVFINISKINILSKKMVDRNRKMDRWARLRKGQIRHRVFSIAVLRKYQLKSYSVQSSVLHYI